MPVFCKHIVEIMFVNRGC